MLDFAWAQLARARTESPPLLLGLLGLSAAVAAVMIFLHWKRRAALKGVPESLLPNILLDGRVKYWGSGTYEARQGNAMWCQDSAQDYFDHGVKSFPGMVVLDCGANVGLFAMELLERLDGQVRARPNRTSVAAC